MATETWAVSMVRDEADIIEASVTHMAGQVDRVLVADNNSVDGTRKLLDGLPCEVVDEERVGYYQAERMTELVATAYGLGADFVICWDADEFWLPRTGPRIADVLTALPDEVLVAEAVVLDHVATNGGGLSPYRRAEALALRKVAVRAVEGVTVHQGNHSAEFPGVDVPLTVTGQLEVRHFPVRSVGQFISKARNGAAAYAATDLPVATGRHWRDWGKLSDGQLGEAFHDRWFSVDPEADGLVFDPVL